MPSSSYIAKLIEKGFKVAICEQMEDPKLAKGVVKREVVRVVTPGLVLDTENLRAKENNFLAALVVRDGRFGLAFVDISTGEFRVTEAEDREVFPRGDGGARDPRTDRRGESARQRSDPGLRRR